MFSLNDFKKWMSHQPSQKKHHRHELIGFQVESKIGIKRLVTKMETTDENDIQEMAKDFKQYGGIVLEAHQDNLLIEVDSGCFTIPKYFVRKAL
jgi:hypothetical protein